MGFKCIFKFTALGHHLCFDGNVFQNNLLCFACSLHLFLFPVIFIHSLGCCIAPLWEQWNPPKIKKNRGIKCKHCKGKGKRRACRKVKKKNNGGMSVLTTYLGNK